MALPGAGDDRFFGLAVFTAATTTIPVVKVEFTSGSGSVNPFSLQWHVGGMRKITGSETRRTFILDSTAAITVGDKFTLFDTNYVEDFDSVSRYGPVEGFVQHPFLTGLKNLLQNPFFDVFPTTNLDDGNNVPDNWTRIGDTVPSVFASTDPAFVQHGTAAARVVTATEGAGLRQAFTTFSVGEFYFSNTRIWMIAGNIKVTFNHGGIEQPAVRVIGQGPINVVLPSNIGIQAEDVNGHLQVVQDGSTASEFYVDAAEVIESADVIETDRLIRGDERNKLWEFGFDQLQVLKDPRIDYRIDLADLFAAEPKLYSPDRFNVGDTLTVIDEDLGLDVRVRVVRKLVNLLNPADTTIEVSTQQEDLRRLLGQQLAIQSIIQRRALA